MKKYSDNFIRVSSFDEHKTFLIDLIDVPPAIRKRIYDLICRYCGVMDEEFCKRIKVEVA